MPCMRDPQLCLFIPVVLFLWPLAITSNSPTPRSTLFVYSFLRLKSSESGGIMFTIGCGGLTLLIALWTMATQRMKP